MFTKGFLSEVRCSALRKGVWYRALDSVERGILFISAKIIDTVKSDVLNSLLVKIIAKLRDFFKSGFVQHFEQFGMERMKIIQAQAIEFGYKGAEQLGKDLGFIKYLMFLDYNQPIGWRIY